VVELAGLVVLVPPRVVVAVVVAVAQVVVMAVSYLTSSLVKL
jgi:hypothetical protein